MQGNFERFKRLLLLSSAPSGTSPLVSSCASENTQKGQIFITIFFEIKFDHYFWSDWIQAMINVCNL